MPARVEVDTDKLAKATRNLSSGLTDQARKGSQTQAEQTAHDIAGGVPVLTGRLRNSVQVVPQPEGFGVSYGSGVPYAWKIERRDGTVTQAVEASRSAYEQRMTEAAQTAARRM